MSSNCIPFELWPDILKFATLKTLCNCRCVCKSWNSIISSPSFIISSNSPLLIARQPHPDKYVLFDPYSLSSLNLPIIDLDPCHRIIGTSNGLLCIAIFKDVTFSIKSILLWNPLTKQCIYIYPPIPPKSSPNTISILRCGFDPITSDFKIVAISREYDSRDPYTVEVFSLRDWNWKLIDSAPFEDIMMWLDDRPPCLLNGAAHWSASIGSSEEVVVAYLFETEELRVIELPMELRWKKSRVLKIGSEMLGLSNYDYTCECEIWGMREYGEVDSWSKMVSLDWEIGGMRSVIWVREDCGVVVVATEGEEAMCYDTVKKKVRRVGFGCRGDGCFVDGFVGNVGLLDEY